MQSKSVRNRINPTTTEVASQSTFKLCTETTWERTWKTTQDTVNQVTRSGTWGNAERVIRKLSQ